MKRNFDHSNTHVHTLKRKLLWKSLNWEMIKLLFLVYTSVNNWQLIINSWIIVTSAYQSSSRGNNEAWKDIMPRQPAGEHWEFVSIKLPLKKKKGLTKDIFVLLSSSTAYETGCLVTLFSHPQLYQPVSKMSEVGENCYSQFLVAATRSPNVKSCNDFLFCCRQIRFLDVNFCKDRQNRISRNANMLTTPANMLKWAFKDN